MIDEKLALKNDIAIMTAIRSITTSDHQSDLLNKQIAASLQRLDAINEEAARERRDGAM